MIEDMMFPDCPIRNIWQGSVTNGSLLVIYTLNKAGKEVMRFKELQREIPDISQKMLTVTLRTLEEDGYITRTVLSGSASEGGVCPDTAYPFVASAHQCADKLGVGEQGCHYRRQEKSKEVKRLHVRFRHSVLFGMQGHTTSSIL